jgi:hypothetical protein
MLRAETPPALQPHCARRIGAARDGQGIEMLRDFREMQRGDRVGRRDHAIDYAFGHGGIDFAHRHVDGVDAKPIEHAQQFGRRA